MPQPAERVSILVVDDDSDALELLCRMIESLGYHPIPCNSGQEAVTKLNDSSFELALLDVMMPEMNGYELLEKLRQHENHKTTPVIMITAKDSDEAVLEGYKQGADYYITKPYTKEQLAFGIKLVLGQITDD